MTKILFNKMHGCGNDFVIIDKRKISHYELSAEQIKLIADRHFGIGCDQVIIIDESDLSHCIMHIYNADASLAASCGNATRCVAWLLMEEHNSFEVTISTKERILYVTKTDDDLITVNMGAAIYDWQKIPLSHEMDVLNMPLKFEDFANSYRSKHGQSAFSIFC